MQRWMVQALPVCFDAARFCQCVPVPVSVFFFAAISSQCCSRQAWVAANVRRFECNLQVTNLNLKKYRDNSHWHPLTQLVRLQVRGCGPSRIDESDCQCQTARGGYLIAGLENEAAEARRLQVGAGVTVPATSS